MAAKFVISGGRRLEGRLRLSGSKNAVLAHIAGTLLTREETVIHNVPHIEDVYTMIEMLGTLGVDVHFDDSGTIRVKAENPTSTAAPYELVKKMRASFYVAGGLLGRLHEANVPLPGGCIIGSRPVNFHTEAFSTLGADVRTEHGVMHAKCDGPLHGAKVYLDPRWSSVGATINVMMAASLAEGRTIIENAARDPEVVDFARFLRRMQARVYGAGTNTVVVDGVRELHGCEHTVISDRIEAGTVLMAAGITGGDVEVYPIDPEDLHIVLEKLQAAGLDIRRGAESVRTIHRRRLNATDISTTPFPGFPTDLQPIFAALMTLAEGRSLIEETIYEARFSYVDELRRMGADLTVLGGQSAIVRGVERLTGAPVESPDIRAGAALVLAALAAEGESEIGNVHLVDRGYENIENKLRALGAEIVRECDSDSDRKRQLCLA